MSEKQILKEFQEEVLFNGPEATLPTNLSDYWLAEIQGRIERYFDEMESADDSAEEDNISLPLVVIIHILFAKNNGQEVRVSMEEVLNISRIIGSS